MQRQAALLALGFTLSPPRLSRPGRLSPEAMQDQTDRGEKDGSFTSKLEADYPGLRSENDDRSVHSDDAMQDHMAGRLALQRQGRDPLVLLVTFILIVACTAQRARARVNVREQTARGPGGGEASSRMAESRRRPFQPQSVAGGGSARPACQTPGPEERAVLCILLWCV